jgi:hypothetical protein
MEPIAARPMRLRAVRRSSFAQYRAEIDDVGIPAYRDAAVHHVYIGTLDTREGTERIFDGARAVGAVNALGVEDRVAFAV